MATKTKPKKKKKTGRPVDPNSRRQRLLRGEEAKVVRKKGGGNWIRVGRQYLEITSGKEDLSKWTDTDLINGRRGGKNGKVPKVLPRAIYDELVRRVVGRAQHQFAAELQYAVQKHIAIIKAIEPTEPTSVQLRAIEMLYERILGKPVEHHALYSGGEMPPWQMAIAQGIVGTADQIPELEARGEIVEGELVDDERKD